MEMSELSQPIVIAILLLAAFIYQRLMYALITSKTNCTDSLNYWQQTLNLCICALPLLGLLGTIMGLLDAFSAMSQGEGLNGSNPLTEGISSALFTTQLGLILAVPAWLLHSLVNRQLARSERHAS